MIRNWMTKPSFYVCRHGETDLNASTPARYRGWLDIPLNEDGLEAAQRVAEYLSYEKLGMICCSDLQRCVNTAMELIPLSTLPYLDINPNLRPLDIGTFAGQPKTARNKKAMQHYIDNPDEIIPGSSETVNQFKSRNSAAFCQYACQAASSAHPLVICCHTSNVTCLYLEGNPDHDAHPEGSDIIGAGGLMAVYVVPSGYEFEILIGAESEAEGTPTAS